jgi:hypothetical protein
MQAQAQTQQIPSVLPVFSGARNYAPLRPLLALKDKSASRVRDNYLCAALKELYREYTARGADVRNEILNVGQTLDNFFNGKQFAVPDYLNGGWRQVPIPRQGGPRPRATSLLGFYRTVFGSRWMQSNPNIEVFADDEDDELIQAAKAAKAEVDHYEDKLLTPWFSWREGMLALTWGTYITRTRLDRGVDGVKAMRQLFDQRTLVVPGEADCTDCRYMGSDTEFLTNEAALGGIGKACPQCGSPNVLIKAAQEQAIEVPNGQEQVNLGDLIFEQLPLPACYWDLSVRPEESSYFIYNQSISVGQASEVLGGAKIEATQDRERGLDIIEALGYGGQAVGGHSLHGWRDAAKREKVTLTEMWLSPTDYAHIRLRGDEETLMGETLPKGAMLSEVLPDGCVMVGLNGADVIIGIYGEKHGPSLATGVYELRAHSGVGRNAADAMDTQARINKLHQQFERAADSQSFVYNSQAITPTHAAELAKPNRAIPADLTALGGNVQRISDVIQTLPPTAFSAQFMNYAFDQLPNILQLQMKTTDFAGGLPGVDNKTATGAQIAASLANGLFRPMAMVKGGVRRRNAEQIVEQANRYFPVERRYSYKGAHGRSRTISLTNVDITRLRFRVVENSELPQNDVIKRMQTAEFFGLVGGFQGYLVLRKQEPMAMAALERIYDFRLSGNEVVDAATSVTNRRIKQLVNLIGNVGLEAMAALEELQPMPQLGEKEHTVKAQRCEEWLDQDEGLDAPLPVRIAVELLARMHYDFEAQRAMLLNGAASAVQMAGMPQGMPQAA